MLVVFTSINPAFLSITNIGNALTFTVELGLIALAMTLLMTAGEFDLSVGSVFGFAPVVMWAFFNAGISAPAGGLCRGAADRAVHRARSPACSSQGSAYPPSW